jgi:hypothetical protein
MSHEDVERPAVGLLRAMDRLRADMFTGRDPENLVTAVVDGDGIVDRITLAATVTGRKPQLIAAAVLAAIADAQRTGDDAVMKLAAAPDLSAPVVPAFVDGIIGGLVDDPHDGESTGNDESNGAMA